MVAEASQGVGGWGVTAYIHREHGSVGDLCRAWDGAGDPPVHVINIILLSESCVRELLFTVIIPMVILDFLNTVELCFLILKKIKFKFKNKNELNS